MLVLVLVVVVGFLLTYTREDCDSQFLFFHFFCGFLVRGAGRGDGRRRPARENGLQPLQDNGAGGARGSGLLRGEG